MRKQKATGTFLNRVDEKLESLSKKERQTAEYMKANQEKLIYSSITELAEAIGTSEATVTRMCTKLDYPSFQALKVSVATELVTSQEKIHEELTQDASSDAIIDKIFSSAIQTLSMTQKSLNSLEVRNSIESILECRRLVVIGNGNSASIAMDAQHKFLRIGMNVQVFTDDHMQMIAMVSLTERDVLLAISHSGSSRNVGDAIKLAKEKKATVITITDSGQSPVSKMADIRLFTHSPETKYRTYAISSRMAELTIIDTLYTGVALRMGEQAISNFEALEKALVVKKY